MRILVTGGAGFIGSRLSLALSERGHEVTVLDSLSVQIHGEAPERSALFQTLIERTRFERGSVTDRDALLRVLPGQDVVVHLAAETGTGQSMYQIEHYSQVNIGGTALLLDLLVNAGFPVSRVVIASSRAIYGEGRYRAADGRFVYPEHRSAEDMMAGDFEVKVAGETAPLELVATDEQSKIHPSSVYGITKQVQEQLVMTVCPTRAVEAVALRYQNVYGPGQSLTNPYTGILSIFSNQLLQGKPINIFEDGTESRDFVFVDDVVDATILAIEHPAAANQIFNVGTGVPVSVLKVAETLARLFERDTPIAVTGNFRIGDIRHNFASIEKIRSLLGFEPAYGFDQGIAAFAAWASASGPQSNAYESSLDEMRRKGLMR
jgi:dTDP-L-rhamnose 4-epimerase